MSQNRFMTPVVAEVLESGLQRTTPTEPPRRRRSGDVRAMSSSTETGRLVRAAAAGDERAWDSLVTRYAPVIRGIARRFRLSPSDQDDVLQRTWLALLGNIGRLKTPEAISGWLATTARNECLVTLRATRREFAVQELSEDDRREGPEHVDGAVDDELLSAARVRAVRGALRRLDGRKQALLEMLMAPSEPSYAEISTTLGLPVGSIGPTRARSLARLRREPEIINLFDYSPRRPHPTRPACPNPSELL